MVAGTVAVSWVPEFTTTLVAGVPPTDTVVAPAPPWVKPVPLTVMVAVPPATPWTGVRLVTVGTGSQVNTSAGDAGDGPPLVVTDTSAEVGTFPGAAGATAVICVLELTAKLTAGVDPKFTAVAVRNPVPVMTTEVPVVKGPAVGLMPRRPPVPGRSSP